MKLATATASWRHGMVQNITTEKDLPEEIPGGEVHEEFLGPEFLDEEFLDE